MSTELISAMEEKLRAQVEHLGELDKDTEEYDKAVSNVVELNKPLAEQLKIVEAAKVKEREHELDEARISMERERAEKMHELEEAKLEFERQKAEKERLEAFRARKAKEQADQDTAKQNHDEFMLKVIVDSALHVGDQLFLGGFLSRGFEFEETGTYGSSTMREVIKRLPFLGKKK